MHILGEWKVVLHLILKSTFAIRALSITYCTITFIKYQIPYVQRCLPKNFSFKYNGPRFSPLPFKQKVHCDRYILMLHGRVHLLVAEHGGFTHNPTPLKVLHSKNMNDDIWLSTLKQKLLKLAKFDSPGSLEYNLSRLL